MTRPSSGRATHIIEALLRHADATPDRTAYVFLEDGEKETERLTFAALRDRVAAVGRTLAEHCPPGSRAVIAYPSGPAYVLAFLGCLYAGVVAVPCDVPGRGPGRERFASIVADAEPAVVLTDSPVDGHPCLDVSVLVAPGGALGPAHTPDGDDPAFLQYTSGSTREPRGVVVTHANLMANERMIAEACGHDAESTFVGWLPLFHDMGMVANVLQPLYLGACSVLMPPEAFLRDPVRWLRAISRYRAHTSGGPNFAYELCAGRIRPEQTEGLDLSSWQVAYNGAEPVRADTLARFHQRFAAHGLSAEAAFPCFGLAEATLIVSGTPKDSPARVLAADAAALRAGEVRPAEPGADTVPLVSSGRAVPDTDIRIVATATGRACAPGQIGEIWVDSPSVARSYWRQPDESEALNARLEPDGPRHLRTGDLGALVDGELYVTGRHKDLIVVRGRNHHPQDLEWTAERAHLLLRPSCSAAFSLERGASEAVVLVCEFRDGADPGEAATAAAAVRAAVLAAHGVEIDEIAFVPRGTVRKTTSGKVRRQWCRDRHGEGALPVSAVFTRAPLPGSLADPGWPTPATLRSVMRDRALVLLSRALLRTVAAPDGADAGATAPDATLVAAGLDSLAALRTHQDLEDRYGVALPLTALLGDASVTDVAALILGALAAEPEDTPGATARHEAPDTSRTRPGAAVREFPLSPGQRAVWFEHHAVPGNTAYHLARALRVEGPLDEPRLAAAVDRVVARHAMLRTCFPDRDGEPVNRVLPTGPRLVCVDASGMTEAALTQTLQRAATAPFAFEDGPPVRFTWFRRGPGDGVLLINAHHLVADFWSLVTILRELFGPEEPTAADAPGTEHQEAADFAAHTEARGRSLEADGDRLWAHWRDVLGTGDRAAALPVDRPRRAHRSFKGARSAFRLPADALTAVCAVARAHGSTLFQALFAAHLAVLHDCTGQADLVAGMLAADRRRAATADLVGHLVDTLPIRSRRAPGDTFSTFLERTRATVLDALDHAVPFPELVAALRPARSTAHVPLVRTLFVMQREQGDADDGFRSLALNVPGTLHVGEHTLHSVPVETGGAQFDISLSVAEVGGQLVGVWEYDTDLFDPATVELLGARLTTLLRACAAHPEHPLVRQPVLDPARTRHLRAAQHGPHRDRTPADAVHLRVARRAAAVPDATAVTTENPDGTAHTLSYAALECATAALAARLRAAGVGAEDRVLVLLPRGVWLPVAYLAAWRAGAVPVPVNPDDPPARWALIAEDSGARAVLTQESAGHALAPVALDPADVTATPARTRRGTLGTVHPQAAACVLYTSGSTGRPKGVVLTHGGLANRVAWMDEAFRPGADERVLHKTPVTFDVSLWELMWPLTIGTTLVVAPPGAHRHAVRLRDLMDRQQVTTAHFVPSVLAGFLDAHDPACRPRNARALRRVLSSGEELSESAASRFHERFTAELHNLYGPTEASIDVTAWHREPGERGPVPIGRPLANTVIRVLDAHGRPAPPPARGQVWIGGTAPARGYLDAPAATALAFRPDPYAEEPGARLYASGDLARLRHDGALEFHGRTDDQVKIAGNRVALAEVAEALRALPAVRDAAVVAHDGQLLGYVVPGAGAEDEDPQRLATAARETLRTTLPSYLVPAAVRTLPSLPLTSAGKLDRSRLPLAAARPGRTRDAEQPPATGLERRLTALWERVLSTEGIGADDDFFVLGGDSITALRVVGAAQREGITFSVGDLYDHPTAAELARHVTTADLGPATATAPFALCPQPHPAHVEDAYPLSTAQRALLFQREHHPGYEVYTTTVTVGRPLDAEALRTAIRRLTHRHAYLRSTFDPAARPEPLQLVHPFMDVPLTVRDLTGLGTAAAEADMAGWLEEERGRPFDTARGPLIRFTAHDLGASHHLTLASFGLDGWCTATVLTEVLTEAVRSTGPGAPPPRLGYADFVALERRALREPRHRDFWNRALAGAPPCRLPRWEPVPRPVPARVRRVVLPVDDLVTERLRAVAHELEVPLKSVLLAAHLRVVRVTVGTEDVTTGLETNGRPEGPDGDRVVGVFNNIVPLRLPVRSGTWADLVRAAHAAERALLPHRRYPLARLDRERGAARLFDTLFVHTHFHLYDQVPAEVSLDPTSVRAPDQTYVPLTAHFNVEAGTGRLRVLLEHDPREFSEEQTASLAASYADALSAVSADPGARWDADVRATPRVPVGEPPFLPVHRLVGAVARRLPDRTAVSAGRDQLSYAGLWAASGRLSAALRARGMGPEDVVALHGARRTETVVALLAVLRAGAAYLPIDPRWPAARVALLLADAGARLYLAAPGERTGPLPADVPVLRTDAAPPARCGPEPDVHPESLADVMFTSGSTGRPKGVGVHHLGLAGYVRWAVQEYGIDADTRSLVHSPLAFDLTVTTLLAPLTTGGAVDLLPGDDPAAAGRALRAGGHTLLKVTPAHADALAEQIAPLGGAPALRTLVIGGEQLTTSTVSTWRRMAPSVAVFNEYGPTETVVGCAVHHCAGGPGYDARVPIGTGAAGATLTVVCAHLPAAAHAVGELHVGGPGVTRGYLGRPAATAASFVPDPGAVRSGARAYRTGDLVSRRHDGLHVFHGRDDDQIKVAGHRMEPGEIEAALRAHPGIRAAAVVLSGRQLHAYIVPMAPQRPPSASVILSWLSVRLPAHMIPHRYVPLPELPCTPNGKVDRAMLPSPERRYAELLDRVRGLSPEEVRSQLAAARAAAHRGSGAEHE
ncbi:amino acid adenylation domain-containing protein [Kitasatospora sp. NPDC101235]|uniref:amino acid adenylation domain-containing protein n=1 Tax=Kitasatospora sp. NPDC101235 TaxID=3364101 RepID=UPI0037FF74AA